ncbi:MAG: hypothetical protein PHO15_05065 [Eubacteriales bacterium]|nr:hypothetical protein [Eubacteriales bacterium]
MEAFVAGCAEIKGWDIARLAVTGKNVSRYCTYNAYGAVYCIEEAMMHFNANKKMEAITAIVEGVDDQGGSMIRLLIEKGVTILGMSDRTGALYANKGIDGDIMRQVMFGNKKINELYEQLKDMEVFSGPEGLLDKGADILVLTDRMCIKQTDIEYLKADIICECTNNNHIRPEIKEAINEKGIFIIPETIINTGDILSGYQDWLMDKKNDMMSFREKDERIKRFIKFVLYRNIAKLCKRHIKDSGAGLHQNAFIENKGMHDHQNEKACN